MTGRWGRRRFRRMGADQVPITVGEDGCIGGHAANAGSGQLRVPG
jgi:hypothetical protein